MMQLHNGLDKLGVTEISFKLISCHGDMILCIYLVFV